MLPPGIFCFISNEVAILPPYFKTLLLSPIDSIFTRPPSFTKLKDILIYISSYFLALFYFFFPSTVPLCSAFHLAQDVYLFFPHFPLLVNLLSAVIRLLSASDIPLDTALV